MIDYIANNMKKLDTYYNFCIIPSDACSIFLTFNFITPVLLTLLGVNMTLKISFNILCNFLYILYPNPKRKFKIIIGQVIKDTGIFWALSVLFGQPIVPLSLLQSFLWSLYTATSINLFHRTIGAIFVTFGIVLSSPLLVLDWMRWWQRWPIPSILGVSVANFTTLVFIKLKTKFNN